MDKSLVPIDPALLALVGGSFGKDGALAPFGREILLLECSVAGTSQSALQDIELSLCPGIHLALRREPQNPNDPFAIMVYSPAGHHLGYVPRAKNEVLARLMDAGKILFAKLEAREDLIDWVKLEICICLRDT